MSAFMHIYTETTWTLIGFVIFMFLFAIFVGSTFLKSQKELFAHLEKLPLEEMPSKEGLS